jgi:formylglycine-generating enzyme required for sulfatase activity
MSRIFLGALLILLTASAHAASMIRVACPDDAAGALVSVNGVVKGECPFDTQVNAGRVVVRAVRTTSAETERVFESSFTLGDDVIKRVDVVMGQPQLSAEGVRRQVLRRQQQEAEAARQRQAQLEREQQRRQVVVAALEPLAKQGAVPGNGKAFRDCDDCPAMVLVPSIQPGGEPLAVGQFEITRGQFAKFVRETGRQAAPAGCLVIEKGLFGDAAWKEREDRTWMAPGFEQTNDHPVVCVTWSDARDYAEWLSQKAGGKYRLPLPADYLGTGVFLRSNSGFFYVPWPWGEKHSDACKYANVFDAATRLTFPKRYRSEWPCNDQFSFTAPVGSFLPNAQGLHDMVGNVAEWLEKDQSNKLLVRGGSWTDFPEDWNTLNYWFAGIGHQAIGFRVVRDLAPRMTP